MSWATSEAVSVLWLGDGQDGDAMMETVEVLIPVAAVGMVQFLRESDLESAGP